MVSARKTEVFLKANFFICISFQQKHMVKNIGLQYKITHDFYGFALTEKENQ